MNSNIHRLFPDQAREEQSAGRLEAPLATADHESQLSFAFEKLERPERIQLFIVPMDEIHGRKLCELIDHFRPGLIIDLRGLIRFDLPGINRSIIINLMRSHGIKYIKEPVSWGSLNITGLAASDVHLSQRMNYEILHSGKGAVFIFVQKSIHVKFLNSVLNTVLSKKASSPWSINNIY